MENESVNQWVDAVSIRALAEGLMKPAAQMPPMITETIYGSGFVGFAESGRTSPGPAPADDKREGQDSAEPVRVKFPQEEFRPANVIVQSTIVEKAPPAKPADSIEVTLTPTAKREAPPARAIARYPSPFKIVAAPMRTPGPAPRETPLSGKGQPLSKRLETFGSWLKGEIPAESYFVCDRNGEVIVDEVGSSKLIKVARSLAHASVSARRQVGESAETTSLHVRVSMDRVLEVIPRQSHFGLVILGIIVPRPLSRETVASIARVFGASLDEK
jgi:hypothetical protein